mgnify:CR=1 FL=1
MFDENLENIVDQFENRIIPVRDGDVIESIAEQYESINHPQIGYRIGEKFLIVDWKEYNKTVEKLAIQVHESG